MLPLPTEVHIAGVYLPPLLLAGAIGLATAWLTALLLNRFRWSRWFAYPPLVFVALVVLYTTAIGTFLIPA